MSAQEALQFNLVSELFSRNELQSKIWPKLEAFAKLPYNSLIATKRLMKKFDLEELEAANNDEIIALMERAQSEESFQAAMEFLQRKKKSNL